MRGMVRVDGKVVPFFIGNPPENDIECNVSVYIRHKGAIDGC